MTDVGLGSPRADTAHSAPASLVDWSAILAGAFLAAAVSFVLLTFGAAIGLSATSPWPGSGLSPKVLASLAIFWAMAQQIGAFMAGGYIAGRMRPRWAGTDPDEVQFRDGLHGGLVWAVGIAIGAVLLLATTGAIARTGIDAVGKATSSLASSNADPLDAVVGTMLRPMSVAQATTPPTPPATSPAAASATPRARAVTATSDDPRAEVSRILASSVATGALSEPDRSYLAQLVAQRTGLSQQEAERRVAEAITQAREAADKARRAAILTGFVTAASLIISFAAAWWAAMRGGHHRDNAIPARFTFGEGRRRPTTLPT